MTRSGWTALVSVAVIAGLVALLVTNTTWVDVRIPAPPRGEAARNPFYGAQRFAEALGARTVWDRTLPVLPPDATLVLSDWRWDLSRGRRVTMERWVESGGRLVVDATVLLDPAFMAWSGIKRQVPFSRSAAQEGCTPVTSVRPSTPAAAGDGPESPPTRAASLRTAYQLCGVGLAHLTTASPESWGLYDGSRLLGVRVAKGRGSVTAVNAAIYRRRELLDGDHGFIFADAAALRRGAEVHFLSEAEHPSLFALLWQQGAAVVLLALSAIGLALWRGGARFGPLQDAPALARRSLAEQILGTGDFALRHGDGAALVAATIRALDEAGRGRVSGYDRLGAPERTAALARLSGVDPTAVERALHDPASHRPDRLRATLALLDTIRRRLLQPRTRSSHGTP